MTVCQICNSEAGELDRIGDAKGFDCPRYGKFKVASTVFATRDPTPEQWERALKNAKAKTPGVWAPCIQTYDF